MKEKSITGVKGVGGKSAKGDKAFVEGTEHVAFHFDYTIDSNREVARFEIPRAARKLLK